MRSFHKMHGLGNDFALFDAREAPLPMTAARARAIADRSTGIGCDQIIILEPSTLADLAMRIWNADGSEVEACGNATRCVPILLGRRVSIETKGGLLDAEPAGTGASVDMGAPRFDWNAIPLAYAVDTADMPVGWEGLDHPAAINVGNPHIVFFVDDAAAVPLDRLGPQIENDPLFPERVNVTVAAVAGPSHLVARTWERGAGLTRACGTAACATGVAAIRRGLVTGPVRIDLPGGPLTIDWAPGGTIRMTGPATHVYRGEIDLEALA
jgi:diaminopimelate epimerase